MRGAQTGRAGRPVPGHLFDSSGVAALVVESFQSARKGGTTFALAAVSEATMRVLQLARLDKVFTIFASVEDGLAEAG